VGSKVSVRDVAVRMGMTLAAIAVTGVGGPGMVAAVGAAAAAAAAADVTAVPRILAAAALFQHVPALDRDDESVHVPTNTSTASTSSSDYSNYSRVGTSSAAGTATTDWVCPPRFVCVSAASWRRGAASGTTGEANWGGERLRGVSRSAFRRLATTFAACVGDGVVLEISPSNWIWRAAAAVLACGKAGYHFSPRYYCA
jgi:hypothetical protein